LWLSVLKGPLQGPTYKVPLPKRRPPEANRLSFSPELGRRDLSNTNRSNRAVLFSLIAGTMMIPSVIAPSAIYSAFMRPAAAPLHSPFPAHPSFLVEDLLRIHRPSAYPRQDARSPCASPPSSTPLSIPDTSRLLDRVSPSITEKRGSCSPKTPVSSKDPTYLKFGVSAILAPSPKKGECLNRPIITTDEDK